MHRLFLHGLLLALASRDDHKMAATVTKWPPRLPRPRASFPVCSFIISLWFVVLFLDVNAMYISQRPLLSLHCCCVVLLNTYLRLFIFYFVEWLFFRGWFWLNTVQKNTKALGDGSARHRNSSPRKIPQKLFYWTLNIYILIYLKLTVNKWL